MKYGEKNLKKYNMQPGTWDRVGLGLLLTKVEFWAHGYDFSIQIWGPGNNNVFINKHDVELASNGGFETVKELLTWLIDWCEKSNPSVKYPEAIVGRPIDLPE